MALVEILSDDDRTSDGMAPSVDPDSLAGESLTPDALENIIESSMAVVREALRIE